MPLEVMSFDSMTWEGDGDGEVSGTVADSVEVARVLDGHLDG